MTNESPRRIPHPSTVTDNKPLALRAVWDALTKHPESTTAELALVAGVGRSTAGKVLVILHEKGLALRATGGQRDGRRSADVWSPNPNRLPASARTDVAADNAAAENSGARADTDEAQAGSALSDMPSASAKHDLIDEPARHPASAPRHTAEFARLGPGQLRELVLAHLTAHPETAFTATRISKAIGRSSGAIANALVTLTKQGQTLLVDEHPRRYQLTGTDTHSQL